MIEDANLAPVKAQKASSSRFKNTLKEAREEILMNIAAIFPDLKNGTGRIVPEGFQAPPNTM